MRRIRKGTQKSDINKESILISSEHSGEQGRRAMLTGCGDSHSVSFVLLLHVQLPEAETVPSILSAMEMERVSVGV